MKSVGVIVATVLAILLVVVVVVPVIEDSMHNEGPDRRTSWEYDDYRPLTPDVISCTGALETVTVGGTAYIHAKDVGQGTIVRSDWSVQTVDVGKAVLDLIYIDGQSNAAQNTEDLETAPVPALGTAYYFGSESRYAEAGRINSQETLDAALTNQLGTWSFQTMLDSDGALKIGDKAPGIAKTYCENTGHRVYIVDGAVPGSPVRYHIPQSTETVTNWSWQWAEAVVAKALESVDDSLFEIRFTGIDLWLQGESDANQSTVAYLKYWKLYRTGAVEGGLGIPIDTIVVCLIANVTDENGTVNAALIELTQQFDDTVLGASAAGFTVEGGELNPEDSLHYTQAGDNIIGEEWGKTAARIVLENRDAEDMSVKDILVQFIPLLLILVAMAFLVTAFGHRR